MIIENVFLALGLTGIVVGACEFYMPFQIRLMSKAFLRLRGIDTVTPSGTTLSRFVIVRSLVFSLALGAALFAALEEQPIGAVIGTALILLYGGWTTGVEIIQAYKVRRDLLRQMNVE